MTVRDLIEELEEYPMDLPVVSNLKEITSVSITNTTYYLDNSPNAYAYSPAVELE